MEYEGLSEEFIWKVFIQVVKGLKSMHDLNIMHRDLKSANVFLNSDDTVKLGDMNVSKVATNHQKFHKKSKSFSLPVLSCQMLTFHV